MKTYIRNVMLLCLVLGTGSCTKFLEEKPDKSLVVPRTLEDLQAVMDNNAYMNQFAKGVGESSTDNFYLTYSDWAAMSDGNRNNYTWGDELYYDLYPNEWSNSFRNVYYTNLVLETLEKVPRSVQNQVAWDNVKGMALFYQGQLFHSLAVNWAKAYDSITAATDLGIPLRLHTDFTETSVRASVQQTYQKILDNLHEAVPLVPVTPGHVMRPSRTAAYALLSRVYLSMRAYAGAEAYADSALALKSELLDYNGLTASANYPVPPFNKEVLFHYEGVTAPLTNTRAKVDSSLHASYAANDLRRTVFFKSNGNGSYAFKGNYTGSSYLFSGLAIDELYLTKAECLARRGKTTEAMDVLNALLVRRWKTGTFAPYTATGPSDALQRVLTERRKELLMRDLRWMDIKRLNREGAGIVLKRVLNNDVYELQPNSPRYALPIPEQVVELAGVPQNPR